MVMTHRIRRSSEPPRPRRVIVLRGTDVHSLADAMFDAIERHLTAISGGRHSQDTRRMMSCVRRCMEEAIIHGRLAAEIAPQGVVPMSVADNERDRDIVTPTRLKDIPAGQVHERAQGVFDVICGVIDDRSAHLPGVDRTALRYRHLCRDQIHMALGWARAAIENEEREREERAR